MSLSLIQHSGHQFKYNSLRFTKALLFPFTLKSLGSLIFLVTSYVPEHIKNISNLSKNPDFESNWSGFCRNIYGIRSSTIKAFNTFIYSNVRSRIPVFFKGFSKNVCQGISLFMWSYASKCPRKKRIPDMEISMNLLPPFLSHCISYRRMNWSKFWIRIPVHI